MPRIAGVDIPDKKKIRYSLRYIFGIGPKSADDILSEADIDVQRSGLWDLFVTVEVSATSGFMKPHAVPFERVRSRLGVPAARTLMVGDNFFADIVGGHRAGFKTALTREHSPADDFDARAPDVRADFVVSSLDELADRS